MALRWLGDQRGSTMPEVMIAVIVSAILLAQLASFFTQQIRTETRAQVETDMSSASWRVQDKIGDVITAVPAGAITLNPDAHSTPDNMEVVWSSYDGSVAHKARFWQEHGELYGEWQDTPAATGIAQVTRQLLAYNLLAKPGEGGVGFEWGTGTGEVIVSLAWKDATGVVNRSWTFTTRS